MSSAYTLFLSASPSTTHQLCVSCLVRTFYSIFFLFVRCSPRHMGSFPLPPPPNGPQCVSGLLEKGKEGGSGGAVARFKSICHLSKIGIDASIPTLNYRFKPPQKVEFKL